MSGVFGIVDSLRKSSAVRLLAKMGIEMSHRDWYVVETQVDEGAGVGLGRIGIGIFNREPQPVWSEDGNTAVFLSGEICGTSELRRDLEAEGYSFRNNSDLELVLRLYQAKGDEFILSLQGVFLLSIWDRNQHEVIIANDRFGLVPLLYAHYRGRFVFAPEMKGILCDPEFRKELDLSALAEYMRFQHLLGDKTFFEGLKLLPNASLLRYDIATDQLTIDPYWDFGRIPQLPTTLSFQEIVEEDSRLLKSAVDRLSKGTYRFGVYLTGGVDSRVILGLIGRDRFPITTITFGRRDSRDLVYAREIAAKVGTEHHAFEFPDENWVRNFVDLHLELTEGFHSWIHAHGISILDQVRPLIDVNLTGFGGASYWENLALYRSQDDITFTCLLFQTLSQGTTWPSLDDVEEKCLYSPSISAQMRGLAFDSVRSECRKYSYLPYERRAAHFSCWSDRRLFQYHTVFHRSHFEERFPFYDYQYYEFIHALPPEVLSERKLRRAMILKTMPRLARVPYDKDNLPITNHEVHRLAAKLIQRTSSYVNRHVAPIFAEYSVSYADYENALRNELRDWGEDILLGPRTLGRGIFNPECLCSLWRRHQSRLEAYTIGKIAPIITYEMMLRRFYD